MRSWWALVAMVVVCATAAAGAWVVFPQTYTALAQHTVEPINVISSGSSFNTVNMETERVVATSAAVLERASTELGGADVSALREATVIQVPRNSQVLEFEVTTRNAERSAEWANALAAAYGEQRTENARTVVEQTAQELTGSIQKLQVLLDAQPEGSSERSATQQQMQALLDQQARLSATPFFAGILVTPASPPSDSNRPGIYVFVAAGLFLGLLLGAVLALIISRARGGAGRTYQRGRHAEVKSGGSGHQVQPIVPEGATRAGYADGAEADAVPATDRLADADADADAAGESGAAGEAPADADDADLEETDADDHSNEDDADSADVADGDDADDAATEAGDTIDDDLEASPPGEPDLREADDDLARAESVLAREGAVTAVRNR